MPNDLKLYQAEMTKQKPKTKPIPRIHHEPAYDWNEVVAWIEAKTGRQLRDWQGKFTSRPYCADTPYQDFWLWMLEVCSITNGCYTHLCLMPIDTDNEDDFWINDILAIIREEFPEVDPKEGMHIFVYW